MGPKLKKSTQIPPSKNRKVKRSTSKKDPNLAQPSVISTMHLWFKEIKPNLEAHPDRKMMWLRTCFGHLYDMPMIPQCGQAVHHMLQRRKSDLLFDINGKTMRFTELDFALIMGLNCNVANPPAIACEAPPHSLRVRRFGKTKLLQKKHLLQEFLRCEDDTDAIKIALVLYVQILLVAKLGNTRIDLNYLSLVNDLESFNQYLWGTVGFLRCKEGLESASITSKKYNIYGCCIAFQIWAFESIPLLGKLCSRSPPDAITFPRILRWKDTSFVSYKTLRKNIFSLKNLEVVILHPTMIEKDQQVVRDACARLGTTSRPVPLSENIEDEEDNDEGEEDDEGERDGDDDNDDDDSDSDSDSDDDDDNDEVEEEDAVEHVVSASPRPSKRRKIEGHDFNPFMTRIYREITLLRGQMDQLTSKVDNMSSKVDHASLKVDHIEALKEKQDKDMTKRLTDLGEQFEGTVVSGPHGGFEPECLANSDNHSGFEPEGAVDSGNHGGFEPEGVVDSRNHDGFEPEGAVDSGNHGRFEPEGTSEINVTSMRNRIAFEMLTGAVMP